MAIMVMDEVLFLDLRTLLSSNLEMETEERRALGSQLQPRGLSIRIL